MAAKKQSQLDYFMDVLLRNYCRASEENDFLYDELNDARDALSVLFKENADLRFKLNEVGVAVPPSDFVSTEQLAEVELYTSEQLAEIQV